MALWLASRRFWVQFLVFQGRAGWGLPILNPRELLPTSVDSTELTHYNVASYVLGRWLECFLIHHGHLWSPSIESGGRSANLFADLLIQFAGRPFVFPTWLATQEKTTFRN